MDSLTHAVAQFGLIVAFPFLAGWLITWNSDALIGVYMFGWLCVFWPVVWKTELLGDGSLRHSAGYWPLVKVTHTYREQVGEVSLMALVARQSRYFELRVRTKEARELRLTGYNESDDDKALADGQQLAEALGVSFTIDPETRRQLYDWKSSRPRRIAGHQFGLLLGILLLMVAATLTIFGGPAGSQSSENIVNTVNGQPKRPDGLTLPKVHLILYVGGVGLTMVGFAGWMSLRGKR